VDSGNGKVFLIVAHEHYRVFPCDEMIEEVERITGQQVMCTYGNESENAGQSGHP
jgi:hypothetical protein